MKSNRRVVITSLGIASSLGNNEEEVTHSLRHGISGLADAPDFREKGFKSQVLGRVKNIDYTEVRKAYPDAWKWVGDGNLLRFNFYALHQALSKANLTQDMIESAGVIIGSGGPSTIDQYNAAVLTLEAGGPTAKKVGMRRVIPVMNSGPPASAATIVKARRMNFSTSAACSTSAIAVIVAAEQILSGKTDVMISGGCEAADWPLATGFDAMGAMAAIGNPEGVSFEDAIRASRAYDADRKGFILAEGAGIVVLEELQHALARGATIYGEIVGFGQSSDGDNMVAPSLHGPIASMQRALEGFDGAFYRYAEAVPTALEEVDYINPHGTATPVGDSNELRAIAETWKGSRRKPFISSTKSLSGHSLGAAGIHELIYTVLSMRGGFLPISANIQTLDPVAEEVGLHKHILTEGKPDFAAKVAASNSFGFGGVNATVIVKTYDEAA